MRTFLRDGFTWRLVGGFVLGAIGVVSFHAASVAGTRGETEETIARTTR